jgi:hypothetical protein
MPSLVSSIYKQKRFLGWDKFWTSYVRDYVIFQIWKTLWHKESGAAVPPYIHWVQVDHRPWDPLSLQKRPLQCRPSMRVKGNVSLRTLRQKVVYCYPD